MSNQDWTVRVAKYVDDLQKVAETMQLVLDQTQMQSKSGTLEQIAVNRVELVSSVTELEQMVEQRERLLGDAEAPQAGTTLIEKLREAAETSLADRCLIVSDTVSSVHQAAISLFVCQFHLANYTAEVLRLLSGHDTPATYRRSSDGGEKQHGGGRIFNDAA